MEAASRPPVEPLPELPVEQPAEGAVPVVQAANPEAVSPEAAKEAPPPAAPDAGATQTVEFLNPDLLLAGEETPAAAATGTTLAAAQVLEVDPDAPLSLEEDTLDVEKILSASAPPPPPSSAPAPASARSALAPEEPLTLVPDSGSSSDSAKPSPPAPKAASAAPKPDTRNGDKAPAAAPVLVPLARRASLAAAAVKLAAASTSAAEKPAAPVAPAAPTRSRPAPSGVSATVTPIAKAAPSAAPASPAPPAPPPPATPPPAEAPSLASWANARAAAAQSAKAAASAPRPSAPAAKPAATAPVERPRAVSPRSAPPPAAPPPAAPTAPAANTIAAGSPPRGMDRDSIARNQVVERYLSGKLPIKAATDFERYCKDHPELLDELGLPERVNAGLRLLEASGKPEPWQEAPKPLWQQPAVFFGVAGFAALLALALAIVAAQGAGKTHKILELQRQVVERSLDAATSTRIIRLLPNRSGASNTPAIVIGGTAAQLVDLHIDESRSPYKEFRVTIDRIDQGRVMIIDNLTKDSNGHLRVAVNSSAFGPGNYLLTIEGLTLRLEPQPDSWVTIGIAQR